ncbi:MAG: hypothetical protein ACJAYF_001991 [Arenicella sp.]|jgi:hypothetical protein
MKTLTRDELKEITGKYRNADIAAELNYLGIGHKLRADGTVLCFEHDLIPLETTKSNKPVVLHLDSL